MAGRGVDIRLGGSDQSDRDRVAELGGLYVIGSGQHESRRVDDQLRGRAGRQGDPGGSVFFVSLEDDLVVRNAGDEIPPSPHMTGDGLVTDEQVDWAVGARPAGRRGRQLRDPPQHVALQRRDRAAAQGALGAARAAAHHRRRRATCCADQFPEKCESIEDETLSQGRPLDRAVPHRPVVGRAPGRARPRSARACTCGRWPGSTRSTSSTARRCRRSTRWSRRSRRARSRRSRTSTSTEDWQPEQARARPAERDLDLPGARQPVRVRDGADHLGREQGPARPLTPPPRPPANPVDQGRMPASRSLITGNCP